MCVCVCACVRACVRACVCVREREKERVWSLSFVEEGGGGGESICGILDFYRTNDRLLYTAVPIIVVVTSILMYQVYKP